MLFSIAVLALAAPAVWIALRFALREWLLRRGAVPLPLRPLTWRPWIAIAVLAVSAVQVTRAEVAIRRRIEALAFPASWDLESRQVVTNHMTTSELTLSFEVEAPLFEAGAQAREWLATRGSWDASIDADQSTLQAAGQRWLPRDNDGHAGHLARTLEDMSRDERPFLILLRRRGSWHDSVLEITVRATAIAAATSRLDVRLWTYWDL